MDLPRAGDISCFFAPTIQHLALSARGSCFWDLLPHSPLRSFSFGVGVWGKRLRGQRAPNETRSLLVISSKCLFLLSLSFCWSSWATGGFCGCGRAWGIGMLGLLGGGELPILRPPLLQKVMYRQGWPASCPLSFQMGVSLSALVFWASWKFLPCPLTSRLSQEPGQMAGVLTHSPWQFSPILLFGTMPVSLHGNKSPDKKQAQVSMLMTSLHPTNLRNTSSSPQNSALPSALMASSGRVFYFSSSVSIHLKELANSPSCWQPALPPQEWLSWSSTLTPAIASWFS